MAIVNGQFCIGSDVVVPVPSSWGMPMSGNGTLFGFTRPYNKPWEIDPIRAVNEPAKPPLGDQHGME